MSKNDSKPSYLRKSKSPSPDCVFIFPRCQRKNIPNDGKYSVLDEMEKMRQRREDRKKRIEEEKRNKIEMMSNPDYIPKLDIDYARKISSKKGIIEAKPQDPHTTSDNSKIFVCVRKRPIFPKELQNGEIDCITALNPKVCIYECKMKIDGYTKYIDTNEFYFDNVFNERENTDVLYNCSIKPTIALLLKGGVVTCFAYGQTGSGKTYTMKGIQDAAIDSIFEAFGAFGSGKNKKSFSFYVSFFEIYSGRLYDLLNNRNKVMALEDKNQKVQIHGLEEKRVNSPQEMREIVDYANAMRTTHNTVTNETSSRSHAICNFVIKSKGKGEEEYAKLTLVDLAGSERATETHTNNKNRLAEGAEINKSLLALKECIRALDARKTSGNMEQHVPFRTSKLTLVLRDSFISKSNISKIIMISCISPGYTSANHTINTLRYSDRLKEKTSQMKNLNHCNTNNNNNNNGGIKKAEVESKIVNNSANLRNNYIQKNNNINNNDVVANVNISDNKIYNNNFINDEEEEDHLQKLNLNPAPLTKPSVFQTNKKKIDKTKKEQNNKKEKESKSIRNNKQNAQKEEIDYLKSTSNDIKPNEKAEEQVYSDEANYINEDYQDIPDIIEEQDFLISSHMNTMKEEAKLLTEEGSLIANIKRVTQNNFPIEEYTEKLENIIKKKLQNYKELKKKIQNFKLLTESHEFKDEIFAL